MYILTYGATNCYQDNTVKSSLNRIKTVTVVILSVFHSNCNLFKWTTYNMLYSTCRNDIAQFNTVYNYYIICCCVHCICINYKRRNDKVFALITTNGFQARHRYLQSCFDSGFLIFTRYLQINNQNHDKLRESKGNRN